MPIEGCVQYRTIPLESPSENYRFVFLLLSLNNFSWQQKETSWLSQFILWFKCGNAVMTSKIQCSYCYNFRVALHLFPHFLVYSNTLEYELNTLEKAKKKLFSVYWRWNNFFSSESIKLIEDWWGTTSLLANSIVSIFRSTFAACLSLLVSAM